MNQILDKKRGIYILYQDKELYYIGKAKNLLSRLKQHLKDKHKNKWNYFSFAIIISEEYIDELESLLLSLIKPLPIENIREERLITRDPETEKIINDIIRIVNKKTNKFNFSKRIGGALSNEDIIRLTMLKILENSEKPLSRDELVNLTFERLKDKFDKSAFEEVLSGRKRYDAHLRWTVTNLKMDGLITTLERNEWAITEKGKEKLNTS